MSDSTPTDEKPTGSTIISAVASAAILVVAGGLAIVTFMTEPTAEKGGATKKTAMLVDVTGVEKGTYRPDIVAQGTVEPAREIVLRPQVGGRITSVSSSFTPGGDVEQGEVLVRIEAADYRHVLAQRRSELSRAQADLAIEKGRHDAAMGEYERYGKELSAEDESLVLREPQLTAAKDEVDAAQAAVDQAQLELSRTTVEAPFDAHIVRRDANLGSQVSPNDPLARLVGTDRYWVGIEVPLSKLRWIETASGDDEGSKVVVRNRQAWAEGASRTGRLYKKVGVLDGDTRMARVLAEISDPLGRETDGEKPELVIGEFLEVTIQGEPLEEVVRIDRGHIREDETVWVMEKGKLRIREVEIAVQDPEWAYVTEGLDADAQVVTTNLSTVTEGARLRLNGGGEGESGG